MSWDWEKNLYSNPEKSGLKIVGQVDFSSGSYEFDYLVVWQDVETGDTYYASDSGCSCPSPFENLEREDLLPINRLQDLLEHVEYAKRERSYDSPQRISDDCIRLVNAWTEATKQPAIAA